MSRSSIMTNGVLLILLGIQLNLVDTYVMTPQFTTFWNERFSDPAEIANDAMTGITNNNNRFGNNYPFNRGFNAPNYQNYTNGTPAFQASFPNKQFAQGNVLAAQKRVTPPTWCCWPFIFLGAVVFLYGAALGKSS